jgi:hypothetical protein
MSYELLEMGDTLPVFCGAFQSHVTPTFKEPKVATLKRVCNGAELLAPFTKSLDPRIS